MKQGRIVSHRYDKHYIQVFVKSHAQTVPRFFKTIEEAREYAKRNGIDIVQECIDAL